MTGDTSPAERAEIIARFKGEKVPADLFGTPKPPLKFLANVNVLTTGFDAVNTDCVVLLRPTNSAGLLIQMVGRGTRLSPETAKENCLVLDFGGNILRHGPVDMISVTDRTPGNGEAPAKKCPSCLALIHAAYQKCPECGHVFPPPQKSKITEHASRDGIISGETFYDDYKVQDVLYSIHENGLPIPMLPEPCGSIIRSASTSSNRNGYAPNTLAMPGTSSRNGGANVPRSAARCREAHGKPFRWPMRGFWRLLRASPSKRSPGSVEPGETWVSTTSPDDPEEEIPF